MGLEDEFGEIETDAAYMEDATDAAGERYEAVEPGEGIVLDYLEDLFQQWRHDVYGYSTDGWELFEESREYLEPFEYEPEAIARYCDQTSFDRDEDRRKGVFIAALVEEIEADEIVLPGMPRADGIGMGSSKTIRVEDDLCNKTGKRLDGGELIVEGSFPAGLGNEMQDGRIIVKGQAGNFVGQEMYGGYIETRQDVNMWAGREMQGGEIQVQGNAGGYAGKEMEGGLLEIHGDAGDGLAEGMAGGTLIVHGDAGKEVAEGMTGGELYLHGEAGLSPDRQGGSVYVKEGDGPFVEWLDGD
jgi:formylmethanofuran dehydrogenase subunit C